MMYISGRVMTFTKWLCRLGVHLFVEETGLGMYEDAVRCRVCKTVHYRDFKLF